MPASAAAMKRARRARMIFFASSSMGHVLRHHFQVNLLRAPPLALEARGEFVVHVLEHERIGEAPRSEHPRGRGTAPARAGRSVQAARAKLGELAPVLAPLRRV